MAKEITGMLKLQIQAGKANPAPPVGPALGQKGVNIMDFCKQFNDKTKDKMGKVMPVVITVYKDKSFTFVTKQPPTTEPPPIPSPYVSLIVNVIESPTGIQT